MIAGRLFFLIFRSHVESSLKQEAFLNALANPPFFLHRQCSWHKVLNIIADKNRVDDDGVSKEEIILQKKHEIYSGLSNCSAGYLTYKIPDFLTSTLCFYSPWFYRLINNNACFNIDACKPK